MNAKSVLNLLVTNIRGLYDRDVGAGWLAGESDLSNRTTSATELVSRRMKTQKLTHLFGGHNV